MSANLRETFEKVIEHFNAAEYDKLLTFMDADIIMKKVDDPGSVVGIGNVFNYLKGRQAALRPILDNRHYDGEPEVWRQDGTMAQVTGTGQMHDKADSPGVEVRFTFTFTRTKKGEDWLVINAFAARKL
jgi:hypothetical protein